MEGGRAVGCRCVNTQNLLWLAGMLGALQFGLKLLLRLRLGGCIQLRSASPSTVLSSLLMLFAMMMMMLLLLMMLTASLAMRTSEFISQTFHHAGMLRPARICSALRIRSVCQYNLPMLGSTSMTASLHTLRMQKVNIFAVQMHSIATRIAVHIGHGRALCGQRGGHNVLTPLRDEIAARLDIDVLIIRLYFTRVHVAVQLRCL